MTVKLEPCPFCRTKEFVSVGRHGSAIGGYYPFAVRCHSLDCDVVGPTGNGNYEAVERWNRRAPTDRDQLLEDMVGAAQLLLDGKQSTYRARNGKQMSIQADDGEACYIVHSDLTHELECALARATSLSGKDGRDE